MSFLSQMPNGYKWPAQGHRGVAGTRMHLSPEPQVPRIAYLPTRTCPSKAREDFHGAPKAGPQQRCSCPGTQWPIGQDARGPFQNCRQSIARIRGQRDADPCLPVCLHVGTLSNRYQPPISRFHRCPHPLLPWGSVAPPSLIKTAHHLIGWAGWGNAGLPSVCYLRASRQALHLGPFPGLVSNSYLC